MKKLTTKLVFISTWLVLLFSALVLVSSANAAVPKFKVHILKDLAPGCNYSINYPISFDYDLDGDLDVLILNKEGTIYFLENLQIP